MASSSVHKKGDLTLALQACFWQVQSFCCSPFPKLFKSGKQLTKCGAHEQHHGISQTDFHNTPGSEQLAFSFTPQQTP